MMIERMTHARDWGSRWASWRLSALAGCALVGLGTFGLARPHAASDAFGMPLQHHRDVRAWRPKAARDLATGVMTLSLLALGDKRALGVYALASATIPATDAVIVARSGSGNPWQVAMHAGTSVGVIALGSSLLRERA